MILKMFVCELQMKKAQAQRNKCRFEFDEAAVMMAISLITHRMRYLVAEAQ